MEAKYDQPGAIGSDNNTQPLKPCLKGDWKNISLLMLMYVLQGVPMGFTATIPMILQNQKNIAYQDQAIFSAASWPNSMKILWAPLVDSFYVTKIGRRKSWLLPAQYLLGFLYFWGVTFILITSLVGLMKKENEDQSADYTEDKLNVFKTYSVLWYIIKIRGIRILIFALITYKIAFAANNVTNLKLIDAGVSQDKLVIVQTALYPFRLLLPIILSKYTTGPKPMSTLLNVLPFRLLCVYSLGLLVYYTPLFVEKGNIDAKIPFKYFVLYGIPILCDETIYFMDVALPTFFSRISDPRFGGTYMTLLYTVKNLGGSWTSTVSLIAIDWLTVKKCSTNSDNHCSTELLVMECSSIGGSCSTTIDGYYLEILICTIIGIIWYICFNKPLRNLQTKSNEYWLVNLNTSVPEKNVQSQSLSEVNEAV
ncbi:acetyl-coenzyme A transporter 1-like isoform X2 [Adelges cooleyi]|uniref:acetyl-coenzyme A transporter 1-like isoform X2 n=1 Tax=Adelges cooleyi TaxID=133065 RepID=UPI00217FEFBF|nr:acetyl-coenzyme A transporter 1-like isoform X2 [Adelges cooleyi]